MSTDPRLGNIDVSMGSGNQIGHIGHEITYTEPAPSPNALYQDGKAVGELGGPPEEVEGGVKFGKLFFDAPFDRNRPLTMKGTNIQVVSCTQETRSSEGGRPMKITLWNPLCRVVP